MLYTLACRRCSYQEEARETVRLEVLGLPGTPCPWCRSIEWRYLVWEKGSEQTKDASTKLPEPSSKLFL